MGTQASRKAVAAGLIALLAALAVPAAASAIPIVSTPVPPPTLPAFQGAASTAGPLSPAQTTFAPENPFMAANPNSNIHDDPWMTDAYPSRPGPLGRSAVSSSSVASPAVCGSLAFDSRGRIVSVCPSAVAAPQVRMIDPNTLATLASYDLPNAADPPGTKTYQNFSGGGYFFLDRSDQLWVPTKNDHIQVIGETADGSGFALRHDYDLTGVLDSANERITSALPDFHGLLWFVSKQNGKVGTLNTKTGAIHVLRTGEEIENSFAVARSGVYIVSDKRMYRFKAKRNGAPKVVWRHGYPNSGIVKPSQVDAGSGTTPTIMRGGYVAITDNADPMDVVVYRNAKRLRGRNRIVCEVPVFSKGASATENSLIGSGHSMLVENNYGYQDPFGPNSGAVTSPGFARVDINPGGRGCKKVWTNNDVRAPTVVPKLSVRTGLIYAYARPPDPLGAQGYYWTAVDFRSGKTVWSRFAGAGLLFNNNYAGLALGPNGSAYLGVIGGMIKLSDTG
jgi:streptogramin lyase